MREGYCKIPIAKLVKADWNYKKDDQRMMAKLIANMKRNGQIENIIVRELKTGFFEVVNGNHRLDAMISLDVQDVQCFNLGVISPAAAKRIATETNETRFPTDDLRLHELIVEMMDEFSAEDLAGTIPVDIPGVDEMMDGLGGNGDGKEKENPYTQNTATPIYKITGEKPELADLCDRSKESELLGRIKKADVPEEIKAFLSSAAARHVVFSYSKIAEFYAHSSPEIQELFEDSALVIIDFNSAIEKGYTKLSSKISNQLQEEHPDEF